MQNKPPTPDSQANTSPMSTNSAWEARNGATSRHPTAPLNTSPNSSSSTKQVPFPGTTPTNNTLLPNGSSRAKQTPFPDASLDNNTPLPDGSSGTKQAPSSDASLNNNTPLFRTNYPNKLELIDDGKVVGALKNLRANCKTISPNEIYLVLNPSAIAEAAEAQFSQKAQGLESWRNSLILLPIMLTWISLGLAGLAYTQTIAAYPKLVAEPLLQQWGDGFTALRYISVWKFHITLLLGTWRYFNFGDVAILDFMLFVILLLLTIRAQSIEAQASKDAIEIGKWLREECAILREHTFARIIGPGAGGDAPEWAVLVNETISDLQEVMEQVKQSISSFDAVLQGDRETVSKALAAVDNLNAIYEAGRRTYEKLEATLPHMDMSFEKMADSQAQAVRSLDKIATSVNASSEAVVQLAQPFASIGVAQLARETFNQLQQIQSQQAYIQHALAQQMNALSHMNTSSQQLRVYQWWDIRRFFPKH